MQRSPRGPRPTLLSLLAAASLLSKVQAAHGSQPAPSPDSAESAKLVAADAGQGNFFGVSVAVSDDTALVGARFSGPLPLYPGAAYVFVRDGSGWGEEAKLVGTPVPADDMDQFGDAVALEGDTAVVGAPREGSVDTGAVYVFVRSGSVWSLEAKLTAGDGAQNDFFGSSVALSGDRILVGAPEDDDATGFQSGSAYLFERDGTTWSQRKKLKANDSHGGAHFGSSVSLAGDTAVVGSPGDDAGAFGSGAAYVFVLAGAEWSQQAKLVAAEPAELDLLGSSVSLSGDTIAVGAIEDDGGIGAGSVHVFIRDGASWEEQAELTAVDAAAGDLFGSSVCLAGEALVVGAPFDDDAGSRSGSAYVFVRNGTSWPRQAKRTASDAAADDEFGHSVALWGSTAVVGAWLANATTFRSGAAYVFDLPLAVNATRNAGLNPASYAASTVQIGDLFTATVDRSLSGRATSLVFGFDTPVDVTLAGGQHLLCLDLGGSGEVFGGAGLSPTTTMGTIDTYVLSIPFATPLIGLTFSTQAIELGPAPFVLSNASDHTVGL